MVHADVVLKLKDVAMIETRNSVLSVGVSGSLKVKTATYLVPLLPTETWSTGTC